MNILNWGFPKINNNNINTTSNSFGNNKTKKKAQTSNNTFYATTEKFVNINKRAKTDCNTETDFFRKTANHLSFKQSDESALNEKKKKTLYQRKGYIDDIGLVDIEIFIEEKNLNVNISPMKEIYYNIRFKSGDGT